MIKKYIVSQDFYDELCSWRDNIYGDYYMYNFPDFIRHFILYKDEHYNNPFNNKERVIRQMAIINWVNGEDVFEIEVKDK